MAGAFSDGRTRGEVGRAPFHKRRRGRFVTYVTAKGNNTGTSKTAFDYFLSPVRDA
jgi:hypothetical protein